MFTSPFISPITNPILLMSRYGSSGPREFAPGAFDSYWTLYNRGLYTLYNSSMLVLTSGGAYTLESGLEIQINGAWADQPGTLIAGDIIRVRATSLNDYFVDGVSGTLALSLTIGGVACTFTLINMVEPGLAYNPDDSPMLNPDNSQAYNPS